jgi:hypothetical protein
VADTQGKYTHLILKDVEAGTLTVEQVERMKDTHEQLAKEQSAHANPEYLESLTEALARLLSPEEVAKRGSARNNL